HLLDIPQYPHAVPRQQFFGHGPCSDATDGLARAGAATATVVAQAVLGIEGEVRVTGTIFVFNVAIISAALIGIAEENPKGRAGGNALEDAGPDLRGVFFLALRDDFRLPRPPAAQIREQILDRQGQARRTAIDDGEVAGSVANAGGGD